MSCELELTQANCLRLAEAFRDVPRVDYSIDCAIEGRMGRAFTDELNAPTAYRITTGPFVYFAGSANTLGGCFLAREFSAGQILMPSSPGWVEQIQELYPDRLAAFPRYSFSADSLNVEHLTTLLDASPHTKNIVQIDAALAASLSLTPDSFFEIGEFDSAEDFAGRGFGFAVLHGETVIGAAYSALVCSRGIEVSIFVEKRWRERSVGTGLACRLLLECLKRGLRPNWDAANTESYKLAKKLGFVFTRAYDAYYLDA